MRTAAYWNWRPALWVLAVLSAALPPEVQGMPPPPPPERWALLVGVNPAVIVHQKQLAELLQREYGYRSQNVWELYGEAATQEGLSKVFALLRERMSAADSLFGYLSLPTIQHGEETLLIPFDGKGDLRWTLISTSELRYQLASRKRPGLLVFPFCPPSDQLRAELSISGGGQTILTFCPADESASLSFASALFEILAGESGDREGLPVYAVAVALDKQLHDAQVRWTANAFQEGAFAFVKQRGKLMPQLEALQRAQTPGAKEGAIETLVKIVLSEPADQRGGFAEAAAGALVSLASANEEAPGVRYRAVRALGELSYRPAADDLGNLFTASADANMRRVTVEALARIEGAEADRLLRLAIQDRDPGVRAAAIRASANRRDQEAIDAIVPALKDDSTAEVKIAALQALAELQVGRDDVLAAVTRLVEHPSAPIRSEAVSTLAALDASLPQSALLLLARSTEDPKVRQTIAYALGRTFKAVDRVVVERALLNAANLPYPSLVREAACWSLGEIGGLAAERRLLQALTNDSNEKVRRTAAEGLGKIRSTQAVGVLASALRSDTFEVRRAAAVALGKIGDAGAWVDLFRALKDEDTYVRREAQESLDLINAAPEKGQLRAQLRDPEATVRLSAVQKLAAARGSWVVSTLIEMLDDEEYKVRQAAIAVLATFQDVVSFRMVTKALESDAFLERQGAAAVLGLTGHAEATQVLLEHADDPHGSVRAEVVRSLTKLDSPHIEALLRAAADKNADVRYAAADGLETFGDDEAALSALLQLSDDSVQEVRFRAIEALRRLNVPGR